jgi:hypothetical protein
MGPVIGSVAQSDHYLALRDGSCDSRIGHEGSGEVLDCDTPV